MRNFKESNSAAAQHKWLERSIMFGFKEIIINGCRTELKLETTKSRGYLFAIGDDGSKAKIEQKRKNVVCFTFLLRQNGDQFLDLRRKVDYLRQPMILGAVFRQR